MGACMRGGLEVAEVLLRAGANVNASDNEVSLQDWHSSLGVTCLQQ